LATEDWRLKTESKHRRHTPAFVRHPVEDRGAKLAVEASQEKQGFLVILGDGGFRGEYRYGKVDEVDELAGVGVVVEAGAFKDNVVVTVAQPFQQGTEILDGDYLRRRKVAGLVANHVYKVVVGSCYQSASAVGREVG